MTRSPAGPDSPQANLITAPIDRSPAGTNGSHGQRVPDTHHVSAVADHFPGGQSASDTQTVRAAGEAGPGQPAARVLSAPTASAPLADPLLALAADVLDDLEKVRVANENRLRQLTRGEEAVDKDGRNDRGFGLDESHPDVARLAALVGMLATAEHQAELNLARLMRGHPLGPWIAAQKGIGEKQGARLLAAIGDPYIRPEITRADSTVEPSRPRTVSELWAFCGYHVIRTPVSGQAAPGTQIRSAADGTGGHPGQEAHDTHAAPAGVAPRRVRGQQSNWSETARKRAWLVAVSCMKSTGPYRAVYDATRARYAEAVHDAPCIRCGPAGKPAPEGSALSDGHKHARALRAVAKEVLRDLWRESRRLHQPAP
jgi:hypothetical protein